MFIHHRKTFCRIRFRFFNAKEKSRRGEHRHNRLRNAILETLSGLRVGRLRNRNQPGNRAFIDGAAISALGETAQNLARINTAFIGGLRRIFREEQFEILRTHPVLFFGRALHSYGGDSQIERVLLIFDWRQRFQLQRERVFSRFPFVIELELEFLAGLPARIPSATTRARRP